MHNNNENISSVDCEVDDILRLLDENTNENNSYTVDSTLDFDSDIMLTEFESDSNNHNEVSALVLST